MVERQVEQGNEGNISIFEKQKSENVYDGGLFNSNSDLHNNLSFDEKDVQEIIFS